MMDNDYNTFKPSGIQCKPHCCTNKYNSVLCNILPKWTNDTQLYYSKYLNVGMWNVYVKIIKTKHVRDVIFADCGFAWIWLQMVLAE